MNFVMTKDEETANALLKAGFQIIQAVGDSWVFMNDNKKMMFTKDKNLKLTYTNKLLF